MMTEFAVCLAYLLGHLFVWAVGYLGWRLYRREPDLPGRWQGVREITILEQRIEATRLELDSSRAEQSEIQSLVARARDAALARLPLPDSAATVWAFAVLAGIFVELEALIFYLLSASSQLLGMSSFAWGFFAPPVSVSWVLMLHVLLGALVSDVARPARTVRRARAGAVLSGGVVVVGVLLVLAGRNFGTHPDLVEELTAAGLMLLAALVSVCGAFCAIVAATIADSQSGPREERRLTLELASYARHIGLLERELNSLQPNDVVASRGVDVEVSAAGLVVAAITPEAPTRVSANGLPHREASPQPVAPTAIIPFMVVLCALVGVPRQSLAQERASSLFVKDGACDILVDASRSVDRKVRQATVELLAMQLTDVADAFECRRVRLVTFVAEPVQSLDEFDVPAALGATDCTAVSAQASTAAGRVVGDIYPAVAEARRNRAVAECLERQEARTKASLADRASALDRIGDRLRAVVPAESAGACTDIRAAVARAVLRAAAVLVVTDGISSCPQTGGGAWASGGTTLVFLLVPRAAPRAQRDSPADLAARITLEFPGSRAVLAPEATTSFWRGLAAQR